MGYHSRPSILEVFYENVEKERDRIFLRQPYRGKWYEYTWGDTFEKVAQLSGLLKSLDLPAGSQIGILSKNCAQWIIADLAIFKAGHVSVPLYPNINAKTVYQILDHSEARVVLVGKLDDWESQKTGVPKGVTQIGFPMFCPSELPRWDEWPTKINPDYEKPVRTLDELATIIYTSGTTGMPKGVMHSFQAFMEVVNVAFSLITPPPYPGFFSYLPLSHIAERGLVETGALYMCGTISFAESLDSFAENLQEAAPTIFLGVPRIWTKFQMGILGKMDQVKLDTLLRVPLLNLLIKNKIKKGLGLHKAKYCFVGAAPMPVSLMIWFEKIDIDILEAYAMTENCCYSHITLPGHKKHGYVGQSLPGSEVKISEEGEVLIKNPSLMMGYYKEPALTEAAFSKGFLKTGDMGEVDAEGYLKITGRVKDNFKTSKGKYIAPNPIEMEILANENIEQCCVAGHNIPQPLCMVVLSEKALQKSPKEVEDSLIHTMLDQNNKLESHENLCKILIVKEPWTVENELMTPTLKIKRQAIDNKYGSLYEKWYAADGQVCRE